MGVGGVQAAVHQAGPHSGCGPAREGARACTCSSVWPCAVRARASAGVGGGEGGERGGESESEKEGTERERAR